MMEEFPRGSPETISGGIAENIPGGTLEGIPERISDRIPGEFAKLLAASQKQSLG